jgi:hypothetical protein
MNQQSTHKNWPHKNFDVFVTLSTDKRGFPVQQLKSNISILFCMIEKKMIGSRFHKKPYKERIRYIGFGEHINDEINLPHYHLLLKFPENIKEKYPNRYESEFKELLEKYYQKFVKPTFKKIDADGPSIKIVWNRYCDVQEIKSQGVVNYVTKGLLDPKNEEHIINHCSPF